LSKIKIILFVFTFVLLSTVPGFSGLENPPELIVPNTDSHGQHLIGFFDLRDRDDCSSSSACKEICDDGIDNDKDGYIDCRDKDDCSSSPACKEICDDGIDNDKDGYIDCRDKDDCSSSPACKEIL